MDIFLEIKIGIKVNNIEINETETKVIIGKKYFFPRNLLNGIAIKFLIEIFQSNLFLTPHFRISLHFYYSL